MYALFEFDQYYPSGGWKDVSLVGTAEEILEYVETEGLKRDSWHLVDLSRAKRINLSELVNGKEEY